MILQMDEHNIIHSLHEDHDKRVTSNYAEIYLNDSYCDFKPRKETKSTKIATTSKKAASPNVNFNLKDEWVSPSDLLIGKVDLVPPFTSKITKGITHEGLLNIGEAVLERERNKFLKRLAKLLADNDAAWANIQEEEKKIIRKKVPAIYERILYRKTAIMQKEISWFYEETLREMEHHLRNEVRTVLMSTRCSIISDLNREIQNQLQLEKQKLEKLLTKKYEREVRMMTKYYKLLLKNEKRRSDQWINQALTERYDAFELFCKQINAEAVTTTMYVMCTERKKCKMRQFLLENFHSEEIQEKAKEIKQKQEILDEFIKNKKRISDINKEWEEKIKKILQLFLKFISYSLKLLPEQTTFLLDLEKLVVLQLNEIQKHPKQATSILINKDSLRNIFKFHEPQEPETVCDKEPFVIEGDLTPSVSTVYGSQETIPLDKELRFVRLQRQFIYAKCQKMDQVRAYLEKLRCKCHDEPHVESLPIESSSSTTIEPVITPKGSPESSNELYLVDDMEHLQHCPDRSCQDYFARSSFPNLVDYLDFDDAKFARVEAILGRPAKVKAAPKPFDPKNILNHKLLFAATKELHRDQETQYVAQEEILPENLPCTCLRKTMNLQPDTEPAGLDDINTILAKRKNSLKELFHENPRLLKMFGEENYDFIL